MRITTTTTLRRAAATITAAALAVLALPGTASAAPPGREADPKPDARAMAGTQARFAAGDGDAFTPVDPIRVLDTRAAIGVPGQNPVGPGGTITLNLGNSVPYDATTVVLNVTVLSGAGPTYVTVYPTGYAQPDSSNVNLPRDSVRPNAVTVLLGLDKSINLYNHFGNAHIIADLAGHYQNGSGSLYNPVTPTRILDTRNGAPVGQRGSTALYVRNFVPPTADAVVFNLTGVNPTIGTYVTAYPGGAAKPEASSLNLVPGQIAPNLVTVPIGKDGTVVLYNHNGVVNLIADLVGYYDTSSGAEFYRSDPYRLVDTRYDGLGVVEPGESVYYDMSDYYAGGTAIVFNLTGTEPSAPTFLTAYPFNGGLVPFASTLNLTAGETAANLSITGFDRNTTIAVANRYGYTHMIWDFAGVFGPIVSASR